MKKKNDNGPESREKRVAHKQKQTHGSTANDMEYVMCD